MKMWMRGVVVTGLLAVVSGAPLEAQRPGQARVRVAMSVARPARVIKPVRRPAVARAQAQAWTRAAALRCDIREDRLDAREDRRDRAEDIADRREDVLDAAHDGGRRDRLEDIADAREDARDQAEDVRDRREDRWDRNHRGARPGECRGYR